MYVSGSVLHFFCSEKCIRFLLIGMTVIAMELNDVIANTSELTQTIYLFVQMRSMPLPQSVKLLNEKWSDGLWLRC